MAWRQSPSLVILSTVHWLLYCQSTPCLPSLFHIITIPCASHDASRLSSQLKQTSSTGAEWPSSLFTQAFFSLPMSKKYTHISSLPDTGRRHSNIKPLLQKQSYITLITSWEICPKAIVPVFLKTITHSAEMLLQFTRKLKDFWKNTSYVQKYEAWMLFRKLCQENKTANNVPFLSYLVVALGQETCLKQLSSKNIS